MIFFLTWFCVTNFFWAYTDSFVIAWGAMVIFLLLYIVLYFAVLKEIGVNIPLYQSICFFVVWALVSGGSICFWVRRQQLQVVHEEMWILQYDLWTQKSRVVFTVVQHVRANTYIGKPQEGRNIYLSSSQPLPVGARIWLVCTPVLAYRPWSDLWNMLWYLSWLWGWSGLMLDDDERFQRRLTARDMQAYCFVWSFTVFGSWELPFWYAMRYSLQQYILSYIEDPGYRSLLLWSTLWDASQFSKETYQQFVDAGLVHLLVVSGGNIALLLGVLNVLLIWMPIRWRWVLCICFVSLYTYICGADSSILRAAVMSLITLFAILWGRTINVRRLLGYASIVLLIINPYFLVYDLWFLLSFWSVVGICLWSHLWWKSLYMRSLSSLWGAVYGTFPIVLFIGAGRNATSILANLCVEFLYILLYLIIFLQWVAILFGWWVSDLVQISGGFVAQLIFWIAEAAVTREIRVGTLSMGYGYLFAMLWSAWWVILYIWSLKKNLPK